MERRIRLMNEAIGSAISIYLMWSLIPKHKRQLLLMGWSSRVRAVALSAAQKSGRWGMNRELSGNQTAAQIGYDASAQIMKTVYDRAGQWYERFRSVP